MAANFREKYTFIVLDRESVFLCEFKYRFLPTGSLAIALSLTVAYTMILPCHFFLQNGCQG